MDVPRTLLSAAAASVLLVLGVADTATANRGHDSETIRMLDDCHPASFNAVLGPKTCVGDGDTTFSEFMSELSEGGDDHWKNNPRKAEVERGEGLHLVNRGGEFHTFTKVARYSDGGCVGEINDLLGVPTRDDAFCFAAFSDPVTVLPPGGSSDIKAAALEPGRNRFQCVIHPWMTTTVVREHHH